MLGVEWPRQKAGLRMADRLAAGADGSHITYCRLCEAQCGLVAEVRDGVIVKVGPDRAHPVSEGHLCVKGPGMRSEEHTSELQSLMRISYAVFCLKKKKQHHTNAQERIMLDLCQQKVAHK